MTVAIKRNLTRMRRATLTGPTGQKRLNATVFLTPGKIACSGSYAQPTPLSRCHQRDESGVKFGPHSKGRTIVWLADHADRNQGQTPCSSRAQKLSAPRNRGAFFPERSLHKEPGQDRQQERRH